MPEYKIWEIERRAAQMLAEYVGRPPPIPVDIEFLAEAGLGLEIVSICGMAERGTLGAVVRRHDDFLILVDEHLMDHNPRRYRFTVAEEVAHFNLHKDVLTDIRTVEEFRELHRSISNYERAESNVRRLAAALLMPRAYVVAEAENVYPRLVDVAGFGDVKAIRKYLTGQLARTFDVSFRAMEIRLGTYDINMFERVETSMKMELRRLA